jgi:YebC/PmpR family DNA-binding regulatory protein
MAGHSKWANIKHKKAATDAKRGKIFTRLIREITVSSKLGGVDASTNARLRLAVDKAMDNNMPKDTIERAIKRGSGGADDASYEEIRYEGYGINGAAVIVDCLTDNRTRTVADVRHAFSKNGGNLGTDGSVAWMFERRTVVLVPADGVDEDALMLAAAEGGADDVAGDGSSFEVTGAPEALRELRAAIEEAGFPIESAELTMLPKTTVELTEESAARTLVKLVEALEELDDVQEVYANFDISEQLLEAVAS